MVKSYGFWVAGGCTILLDQMLKIAVKQQYLQVPFHYNTGSLWGIFPGSAALLSWFTVLVIGIIFYKYEAIQRSNGWVQIATGLITGGAIGNMIDRIAYKGVIDFITLGWWPSFNVADSAIVAGVILLAFNLLKNEDALKD